ncbi:hypothetical protein XENOCAPTIV_006280, partial [Xenoophorus captivus]
MRLATFGLLVVSLLFYFAQLCLSEKLECFPTENSDGTFYSVPPYEDLDCIYSWTNVTDHVLANNDGKADKDVIASNCTSLHTFKCYKTIKYFRDCTFEGEKTATCKRSAFRVLEFAIHITEDLAMEQ